MPSRAWVVTRDSTCCCANRWSFNALSGLYLISTSITFMNPHMRISCVNALSGLYLISTVQKKKEESLWRLCQCPLGLIPHFYRWKGGKGTCKQFVCQCPLGLIPHFYNSRMISSYLWPIRVNALSGLYLISTVPLQKPRFYAVSRACFCRYLSEYSDNSRFSCMLTFWTYLMRCTYPWHWIKYSTNYNRCHPIFSLSW